MRCRDFNDNCLEQFVGMNLITAFILFIYKTIKLRRDDVHFSVQIIQLFLLLGLQPRERVLEWRRQLSSNHFDCSAISSAAMCK